MRRRIHARHVSHGEEEADLSKNTYLLGRRRRRAKVSGALTGGFRV
jgi:hypothetical protein